MTDCGIFLSGEELTPKALYQIGPDQLDGIRFITDDVHPLL